MLENAFWTNSQNNDMRQHSINPFGARKDADISEMNNKNEAKNMPRLLGSGAASKSSWFKTPADDDDYFALLLLLLGSKTKEERAWREKER